MSHEAYFPGFNELIQNPLARSDPPSFKRIKNLFMHSQSSIANPFGYLIKSLADKIYSNQEAQFHWRQILSHKKVLEEKLERSVSVKTAAVDYFSLLDDGRRASPSPHRYIKAAPGSEKEPPHIEEWEQRMFAPGYHMERLRDEMLRSKRYSHALSAIMLDLDRFHEIDEGISAQSRAAFLHVIARIIKSTIRAVDITARFSDDVFLIILPNTNKREALELAERLRRRVQERTRLIETFPGGMTATLSVGQVTGDEGAQAFIGQLEHALVAGKNLKPNSVYSL